MSRHLSKLLVAFGVSTLSSSALAVTYQWKSIEGPTPRDGASLAFDEGRNRAVLFGGFSASGTLNDTWEWDGASWLLRQTLSPPATRAVAGSFYDADRGRVALVGGVGSTYFDDAYLWNGSSWKPEIVVGATPPQRTFASFTYDAAEKKWVMFGGASVGGIPLADTWEYDSSTNMWTERKPAVSPPARYQSSMAYDSVNKVSVLVGGVGSEPNLTPWEWDSKRGTWTALATNALPARARVGLAFDRKRGRMVMFGGLAPGFGQASDTYELRRTGAGTAVWDLFFPATSPGAYLMPVATYDTVRERVLLYGNDGGDAGLWDWDGTTWTQRGPGGAVPTPRGFPSVTFDSLRKRVVFYGGTNGTVLGDLWEWDGTSWHAQNPTGAPSGRFGAALTFDSARGRSVMFGGEVAVGTRHETWEWDGAAWFARTPAHSPPDAGGGLAATFDSARGVTVLSGLFESQDNMQTWEWNGVDWTQRTFVSGPPVRHYPCMAFDPVRGESVFFGGADSTNTTFFDSTWIYNGTTWTERTPANHPSKREHCLMTFDPSRGHVVLFGGQDADFQNDMWEWDGTDWKKVDMIPTPIVAPLAATFAFDGEHLVLAGTTLSGGGMAILVPKTDVCTTTADCTGGTYCVDGVCCQSTACDACETCNGIIPGACSPILNQADPDSCTGDRSCSAKGQCLSAPSVSCSDGSSCASGFCVDGVCCDSACTGTCVACSAALKESGDRDGLCGPAKAGTDIRNQCEGSEAPSCGLDGTCDGAGACRKHLKGTICDTAATCTGVATASAKVCDGLGTCSSGAEPVECKGYLCVDKIGCPTSCAADAECNEGFKCRDGACVLTRVGCATVEDCAPGFVCDFEGQCIIAPAIVNPTGCAMGGGDERSGLWFAPMGAVVAMAIRKVRRRRA